MLMTRSPVACLLVATLCAGGAAQTGPVACETFRSMEDCNAEAERCEWDQNAGSCGVQTPVVACETFRSMEDCNAEAERCEWDQNAGSCGVQTPVVEDDLVWCDSDNVCRVFGDTGASCNTVTSECICSDGFIHKTTATGNEAKLCFSDQTSDITPSVATVFEFTYPEGQCTSDVVQRLIATHEGSLPKTAVISSTAVACGSIHMAHLVTIDVLEAADLFAEGAEAVISKKVQDAVDADPVLANKAGKGELKARIVEGSPQDNTCAVDNAAYTYKFPIEGKDVCKVLQCKSGYSKRETAEEDLCVRDAEPNDGLSGGQVAGIVIGSVVFLVVVVVSGIMIMRRKASELTQNTIYSPKEMGSV